MKTMNQTRLLPLIAWMICAASRAGQPVVEAELHEDIREAFVNPGKTSSLPRVLIIGDSISIGYTDPVRRELEGVAQVSRAPVNCQHTGYGLSQITKWLGKEPWDVIHFNFGIWDTHLLDAKGQLIRQEAKAASADGVRLRHTPEQYGENLAQLVKTLQKTQATVIWASSTPIMSRTNERLQAIPRLNEVAAGVMKSHGITVNDLYAFVMPHVKEWQNPDRCHFNKTGNEQLGKQVADHIRQALKEKKK